MDSTQINAELVGASKAQRLRIAGRAVMRVLPLLAIKATESPFEYWSMRKREVYIHTLFRMLLPALTDKVKPGIKTLELAAILHDSSQHTHIEHLLMALRNIARVIESQEYPAVCEASMAAMKRSEDAADAALRHYIISSDHYASLKEEKYGAIEQVRYASTYITAYSPIPISPYSAVPSGGSGNSGSDQLLSDLEEVLRRDILHIGARGLHDKPLPVGMPLWHQVPVPAMLTEALGRMEDWLITLGGDCPRWVQLYRATLNGKL